MSAVRGIGTCVVKGLSFGPLARVWDPWEWKAAPDNRCCGGPRAPPQHQPHEQSSALQDAPQNQKLTLLSLRLSSNPPTRSRTPKL
jgi:hypothetical protein